MKILELYYSIIFSANYFEQTASLASAGSFSQTAIQNQTVPIKSHTREIKSDKQEKQ